MQDLQVNTLIFICLISQFNIHRTARDSDPSKWPQGQRYIYSASTSTTSLRPHIEKYHLPLYQQLAQEHRWKVLLPGLVSLASAGTSATTQDQQPQADRFTQEAFHKHLLNFIVSDDQVRSCFILTSFKLKRILQGNQCY